MFATGTLNPVDLDLSTRGIGDEQVSESAPLVRALVVQRLEQIWTVCEPHVTGDMGKPDPRFIEAGIRVLDRMRGTGTWCRRLIWCWPGSRSWKPA